MYRDTYLEINVDNLKSNIEYIAKINPNKKIMAIVKANAYGHGLIGMSKIMQKNEKINSFGVATLDEAIILRKNEISKPILVLGAINFEQYQIASQNDISITIYSKEIIEEIQKINFELKIHIKIETGMNRLGIKELHDYTDLLTALKNNKFIKIIGIYTHFSSADDDQEFTLKQMETFKIFIDLTKDLNIEIHCQNSAGLLNFQNLDFVTMIRPGICLYGIDPTYENKNLKELITLKSKISLIKKVQENTPIGYNKKYITNKEEIIGTFQLGYADGFKQSYNVLYAYNNNNDKFKIIGKICMDQLMVVIDETITKNQEFEFINQIQNIKYISKVSKISEYEILTSLSSRLQRKYIENVI